MAAVWRKSSRSGNNANCVEIAHEAKVVGIRDSKNATGPELAFGPGAFTGFLDELKIDHFD